MALLDLTGKKFGRWTVVERLSTTPSYWECRCKCGTVRRVAQGSLTAPPGATYISRSCGCHRSDSITRRNLAGDAGLERRIVSFNGKQMTVSQVAHRAGITPQLLFSRLRRGIPLEKAISRGRLLTEKRWGRKVRIGKLSLTIRQWSEKHGVPVWAITSRLNGGWPPSKAVSELVRKYSRAS